MSVLNYHNLEEPELRERLEALVRDYIGVESAVVSEIVETSFDELFYLDELRALDDNLIFEGKLNDFYIHLKLLAQEYLGIDFCTQGIRDWARSVIGKCQTLLLNHYSR